MEIILTSILAFASTNIDDIFILIMFFSGVKYRRKAIVIGQYVGIITLITISLIGSQIGLLVNQSYIGLLGLLPIFFGIREATRIRQNRYRHESPTIQTYPSTSTKMLSVAALTIANGGDNIGIYIPLFAPLSTKERTVMVFLFLVLVAVWCVIASYLSKRPAVSRTLGQYSHIITPVVLVLLGIYILHESGSFALLF